MPNSPTANPQPKFSRSGDNAGVIAFPPLIWLVGAVSGVLVHFLHPTRLMNYSIALTAGIFLAVLGMSLAAVAALTMKAAGTNVNPGEPTLTIVRTGPYRFTRNPMYLSLCLIQLGLGFLFNDWVPLLVVIPLALVLHYGVILREERYLEGKFGEQYLGLKRSVRRWI